MNDAAEWKYETESKTSNAAVRKYLSLLVISVCMCNEIIMKIQRRKRSHQVARCYRGAVALTASRTIKSNSVYVVMSCHNKGEIGPLRK